MGKGSSGNYNITIYTINSVNNAWGSSYQGQVVLPLKPFLKDESCMRV